MVAINPQGLPQREEWIAHLTQVTYQTILERGFRGSFLELELSLWREIRQTVERTWAEDSPPLRAREVQAEVA